MRVLVTGIAGFAGSHLAERLVADGHSVHGFAVEDEFPNLASVIDDLTIHAGDITDPAAVASAVRTSDPEVIFHLAAQSIPTLAAQDPVGTVRTNVLGTTAVLDAMRPGMRLVLASSADIYGLPDVTLVNELTVVRPKNVYAASKVAAEAMAREYGDRGENTVVILRPTNHIGPRQRVELVASSFAKQIADAEAGRTEPLIRHGSLTAQRDFIDVGDMADAYVRAAGITTLGTHEFTVGSGRAVGIDVILATLVGLARVPIRTELDPARVRPGSAFAVSGRLFGFVTGWEPVTDLRTSLDGLLNYWRAPSEALTRAAFP